MKIKGKLLISLLSAVALCGCFIGCNVSDGSDNSELPNDLTDSSVSDNDNNDEKNNETVEPQKPVATEGLEYEKIKKDNRVVGYRVIGIGTAKDIEIVIPDEYEERPVTSIGAKAFEDCYKVTKITLPDTITDIKEDAFIGCEKLEFSEYGNIKYLGTADSEYFAGIEAKDKSISSCNIHAQTKVFAKNAFSGCTNLDNVEYTGKGITEWCEINFSGDFANPLCMKTYFRINGKRVNDLVIPDTVTDIKKYTFSGMKVQSVEISSSVTDIGYAAFSSCTGITSDIVIPTNVKHIDKFAFAFISSYNDIKINAKELVMEESAFSYCDGIGKITISGENVMIGEGAFSGCPATSLIVSGGSFDVGYEAFKHADLASVSFINSSTAIHGFAFDSCSKLAYAKFEHLSAIDSYAFSDCDMLSEIIYGGTKYAWSLVDKRYDWIDYGKTLTIRCSDGTVIEKR